MRIVVKKVNNVFIHAFTDGRDTDPKSAVKHISDLEKNCYGSNIALFVVDTMLWTETKDGKELS